MRTEGEVGDLADGHPQRASFLLFQSVAAPQQDMPSALAVKGGNNKIVYQDILTALADATNDLPMSPPLIPVGFVDTLCG